MLVRAGRFFGRTLFAGMSYAPLVMPDVITGLSLLLLFIALGIDRGIFTVVLAHTTFLLCYVAVVISARLRTLSARCRKRPSIWAVRPSPPFGW